MIKRYSRAEIENSPPVRELTGAITGLERQVAATGNDARLRYNLALLLMRKHGWTKERKLLAQARKQLERAVALRPKHVPSHALLGYAHDLDLTPRGAKRALACFREARRLDPRDRISDVYVLRLLCEVGPEKAAIAEIEAAAPRNGVDLRALRRQLKAARFKADALTLLMNGFIHARNFFRSKMERSADRLLNTLDRGRAQREAGAERERCLEDQRALERSFDASKVPQPLRPLAKWASRYGVGDDVCRPYLLRRLSKKQRTTLTRAVDKHAPALNPWLDSFGDALKPTEAAALMYLALGVEEIRE